MEDNYSQFVRHEEKRERWLQTRPVCMECDEPIQDEQCFEINGEPICDSCMIANHRKHTEDLVL